MNFLSNFYIPPCAGKIFKFMEFKFLENALVRGIFTHAPLHSKLIPKFLSSRPRQEITHSPRQRPFENLFTPIEERDGGNYDLLYQIQSENMQMTWNIRFFIFCLICNISQMWWLYSFVNNIYHVVRHYFYCFSFATMIIWY